MCLKREFGQDTVEYAIVLPLLILLMMGIAEFGILLMSYTTIANAVREGARAGVVPVTEACDLACLDAAMLTAAQRLTTGLDPAELTITVQHPSADSSRVDILYNVHLMTSPIIAALGGQDTISLQTTATMQRE